MNQTPSKAELDKVVALYNKGQLKEALVSGHELVARYPDSSMLENILGVLYAALKQFEDALLHYDNALRIKPDYPEALNNKGNTLNELGNYNDALGCFENALRKMPGYAEAHNNLGSLLHSMGELEKAQGYYQNAIDLKPDYVEAYNNLGNVCADLNQHTLALQYFAKALRIDPNFVQAYNSIGHTLRLLGRPADAITSFEKAIARRPVYAEAYNGLGATLNDMGLHAKAVENIRKAIEIKPDLAAAHSNLGNALSDLGHHEESISCYTRAIALQPSFAEVHNNLGNSLCEFGRYEEAISSFDRALALKPEFAEAHNNLSRLKNYTSDDPQLAEMLERIAIPDLPDHEVMHLSFALGKAYEDLGEIDKAFRYLETGNRLRKQSYAYNIQPEKIQFEQIKKLFNAVSAARIRETQSIQVASSPQPIFIVGMPRSGTTLTEQILASHSQVFGGGELETLGRLLNSAVKDVSNSGGASIATDNLMMLRDEYLSELETLNTSKMLITDKMPPNFKWIGFLLSVFDQVKIINVQREPVASCWSMFKLQFKGHPYTNDIEDIAAYYNLYLDLMAFWRNEFPNQIYDLNYEALTRNQEQETRRLLDYCGLDWELGCLNFYENKRPVRTPSGRQVRRKMYQGSSEEWRKYEKQLQPMLAALANRNP